LTEILSSKVPGDLCNRRGDEIAAAEGDRLAVEPPAMHDASGLHALLTCPAPERRGRDDSDPLHAGSERQATHDLRLELELAGYAVARVDS
jgi:hypothetical protein